MAVAPRSGPRDSGPVNLGEIISSERQRRRLSQAELAERIGVHKKTISKWETGQNVPSRHLVAIEDALGIRLTNRQAVPARPTEMSQMSYPELLHLQMRITAELARRGPHQPHPDDATIGPDEVLRRGWSATRSGDLDHPAESSAPGAL